MKKTQQQIDKEIAMLREIKPKIRRYSAFGDDHHKAIDIQIAVLERNLDEDEINEEYSDADDNSHAYDAVQWRNGDAEEDLAASYSSLILK